MTRSRCETVDLEILGDSSFLICRQRVVWCKLHHAEVCFVLEYGVNVFDSPGWIIPAEVDACLILAYRVKSFGSV